MVPLKLMAWSTLLCMVILVCLLTPVCAADYYYGSGYPNSSYAGFGILETDIWCSSMFSVSNPQLLVSVGFAWDPTQGTGYGANVAVYVALYELLTNVDTAMHSPIAQSNQGVYTTFPAYTVGLTSPQYWNVGDFLFTSPFDGILMLGKYYATCANFASVA
jgi:hypothetical protein